MKYGCSETMKVHGSYEAKYIADLLHDAGKRKNLGNKFIVYITNAETTVCN
jgi:hypothetical protein